MADELERPPTSTLTDAFPGADIEEDTSDLTRDEARRLQELEKGIERAGRAFAKATYSALLEIHDRKLYRARYKSFATYCLNRWGWTSRGTVYYHLNKAKEAKAIEAQASEMGTTPTVIKTVRDAKRDAAKTRERKDESAGQCSPSRAFSESAAKPAPVAVDPPKPAPAPEPAPAPHRTKPHVAPAIASLPGLVAYLKTWPDVEVSSVRGPRRFELAAELKRWLSALGVTDSKTKARVGPSAASACKHPVGRRIGSNCGICGAKV